MSPTTVNTTLVVAPNRQLYDYWLLQTGRIGGDYKFVMNAMDLANFWGPIVILNNGSSDRLVMNIVNHPSRRAQIARQHI